MSKNSLSLRVGRVKNPSRIQLRIIVSPISKSNCLVLGRRSNLFVHQIWFKSVNNFLRYPAMTIIQTDKQTDRQTGSIAVSPLLG